MTVIGDVTAIIIVDDMCDTAGTLCKAAEVLMEAGASEFRLYHSWRHVSPAVDASQIL